MATSRHVVISFSYKILTAERGEGPQDSKPRRGMKPGVDQARTQSKDGASVWRRQGAPGAGGRQRLSPGSPRLPTPAPHREGWSSPPPWPGGHQSLRFRTFRAWGMAPGPASEWTTYLPWGCWGPGGWQTPRPHIPAVAAPGRPSDLGEELGGTVTIFTDFSGPLERKGMRPLALGVGREQGGTYGRVTPRVAQGQVEEGAHRQGDFCAFQRTRGIPRPKAL